jgi:hypothetical protein
MADSKTSVFTGLETTEDVTVSGGDLTVTAEAGVTVVGPLTKLEETVAFGDFTDGGSTVGTYDITVGTVPIGATVLAAAVVAVTGFAGDTSATLTIGDGTDVDRYNTSTVNVFATAAGGVDAGVASGVKYHASAKTVKLTITTNADFTSVSAGSVSVELYYLT